MGASQTAHYHQELYDFSRWYKLALLLATSYTLRLNLTTTARNLPMNSRSPLLSFTNGTQFSELTVRTAITCSGRMSGTVCLDHQQHHQPAIKQRRPAVSQQRRPVRWQFLHQRKLVSSQSVTNMLWRSAATIVTFLPKIMA
jgi:hypothetical protein